MIKFWKNKEKPQSAGERGPLNEREIQERIYGRYAKSIKEPVQESPEKPVPEEIKPAPKVKETVEQKAQEELFSESQGIIIQRFKGENDSLRREMSFLKKQNHDLSKQKSSLSVKLVRLEEELSRLKQEYGLVGAGQMKEKAIDFLISLWKKIEPQKTIWAGVGVIIAIITVSIVVGSRAGTHELNKEDGSGQKPAADVNIKSAAEGSFSSTKQPYTIQVCIYQKKSDAEKLYTRLKSKGYNVEVAEVPSLKGNQLFRIYVGRFSSREQADKILQKVKTEEGFRDSFVRRR